MFMNFLETKYNSDLKSDHPKQWTACDKNSSKNFRPIGEDFTVGFPKQPRLTVTGTCCG